MSGKQVQEEFKRQTLLLDAHSQRVLREIMADGFASCRSFLRNVGLDSLGVFTTDIHTIQYGQVGCARHEIIVA